MELAGQVFNWIAVLLASVSLRHGSAPAPENPAHYNTVALVDSRTGFFCSGSLIDEDIVLTAAHCLMSLDLAKKRGSRVSVYFGKDASFFGRRREGELFRPVVEWRGYYHPHADTNSALLAVRDIGWVRFSGGLPARPDGEHPFSPVPILESREIYNSLSLQTHKFLLAGYGQNGRNMVPARSEGFLNPEDHSFFETGNGYLRSLNSLVIYSSNDQSQLSCSGDSGGPLYVLIPARGNSPARWHILGVMSLGNNSCKKTNANLYELILEDAPWFLEDPFRSESSRLIPPLLSALAEVPRPEGGSFQDWCLYTNSLDPAWMTMNHFTLRIPSRVLRARAELGEALECSNLENVALEQIANDRGVLKLEYSFKNHSGPAKYPFLQYLLNPARGMDLVMDLTPLADSPILTEAIHTISLKGVKLSSPEPLAQFKNLQRVVHYGESFIKDGSNPVLDSSIEVISLD